MPSYEYAKWDGSQDFQPQSADELFEQLTEHILHYGDRVMKELERLDDDHQDVLELLRKQGVIEKDLEGQWTVTPKGVRQVQDRALRHLFQAFQRDSLGKHDTSQKGAGSLRLEDSRPYVYGDPLANLNLHETLKNAMVRQGGGTPIRINRDDFVVYETEYQSRCATVILIDMSGSMGRFGKYGQCKRVALALQGLVRAQYPQDSLQFVGFHTYADVMTERQLLNSAPKRVSMFDPRVHLRISLDNPPNFVPQHFTNIHAGMKLARSLLSRQPAVNKQIIIITDGEPTAHLEDRDILLIYPPSERTARQTLAEGRRCAASGIRVSSFALIEDDFYFGLVNFVQDLAKETQGTAAYCHAENIGNCVFESFVHGRRSRRANA